MLIFALAIFCCPSVALSTYFQPSKCVMVNMVHTDRTFSKSRTFLNGSATKIEPPSIIIRTRGGGGGSVSVDDEVIDLDNEHNPSSALQEPVVEKASELTPHTVKTSHAALLPTVIVSSLQSLGNMYAKALVSRPIVTKSFTAGVVFALSDYTAQKIDAGSKDINWVRTLSTGLVGLLYFGPAAHYWYQAIFHMLPGTSFLSTLQKAALGQLIFGPSFTCIFFAVSLLQARSFTLKNWVDKIQADLPKAWAAGLSFWSTVDLVGYSIVPKDWIPLFINFCSFVWNIYLSIVANNQKK